jgi:transposase
LGWLTASGCTHVAMEATGVYWKPVWNILSDGAFELIVANAAHIKNSARPQDRRERCDMDRGFGRLRADQGELRSGRGPIQQLRSLLRAQATDPRAKQLYPADPEDARRGQY